METFGRGKGGTIGWRLTCGKHHRKERGSWAYPRFCRGLIFVALAGCLSSFPASAQSLPPDLPHRDPPPPLPTDAQLERGREVLDKIVEVIARVPLDHAVAVFAVFGFSDLDVRTYPTHVDFYTKTAPTLSNPAPEFTGTGLRTLSLTTRVRPEAAPWSAYLGGVFNVSEACVSLADVRHRFRAVPNPRNVPVWVVDRGYWPPARHEVDRLVLKPLATPAGDIGRLSLWFNYQICATDFNFTYSTAP